MSVGFLTPAGAAVALAAAAPVVVLFLAERRAGRARAAIGLPPRSRVRLTRPVLALAAVGVLAGLAAAQPVLRSMESRRVRTDAAVLVVIDTTRSMLAASSPASATRIERARIAALALRHALPDVPVGIASISDRVLPHLFPTLSRQAFAATLLHTIRPGSPPSRQTGTVVTDLGSLAAVATENFFAPGIDTRLVVLLTDGESSQLDAEAVGSAFRSSRGLTGLVVRIGGPREFVFDRRGRPERDYLPDPAASAVALQLAESLGGTVVPEGDLEALAAAARRAVGSGETKPVSGRESSRLLSPYALLAAALPLAFLVRRRNLR